MAFFGLNAQTVTALQARLTSELPAKITEINALVTDGYTNVAPVQVLDYVPLPAQLTAFPTIGIGDLPSTFADDTGFSVTGHHGLSVMVFLSDPDQRALAWKLRRYLQAITTVALRSRQLGDTMGVTLRRIVPGPTLDAVEDPRAWLTWASVDLAVLRNDDA